MPSNSYITESTITCPVCGYRCKESMPVDACQLQIECCHCRALLTAQEDDCCVFCSYGDVPCPPLQRSGQGLQG